MFFYEDFENENKAQFWSHLKSIHNEYSVCLLKKVSIFPRFYQNLCLGERRRKIDDFAQNVRRSKYALKQSQMKRLQFCWDFIQMIKNYMYRAWIETVI